MRKSFKLQNLGCANCAAKMQDAISKLDGVNSATVNFMYQKLTLDADDERFEDILDQCARAIARYEPDCSIVR